jgi:hypothetical protein
LKQPKDVVIEKILNNPIYREKLEGDKPTLEKFATVLSSKSELKRTYLNTDWLETVKMVL